MAQDRKGFTAGMRGQKASGPMLSPQAKGLRCPFSPIKDGVLFVLSEIYRWKSCFAKGTKKRKWANGGLGRSDVAFVMGSFSTSPISPCFWRGVLETTVLPEAREGISRV